MNFWNKIPPKPLLSNSRNYVCWQLRYGEDLEWIRSAFQVERFVEGFEKVVLEEFSLFNFDSISILRDRYLELCEAFIMFQSAVENNGGFYACAADLRGGFSQILVKVYVLRQYGIDRYKIDLANE